jgi:arylsulfatase A-like enzyme/pimeloyl-ACP methyl ester carboxylesterase
MRGLILSAVAFGLLCVGGDSADAQQKRPNILVIVSDDMGYADIGIHGSRDIRTPFIDALANGGIRFTDAYVTGPYCAPTRAGLLTGRYQQRFGHEFNTPLADDVGLPLDQVTMADRLKAAGYRTALIGKWHLGSAQRFHPMNRGFDEFFGFLGGAHSYLSAETESNNSLLDGRTPVRDTPYLTDAFADRAVDFIRRNGSQPFFLYLAFNAVHTPMHATEKYLSRFQYITNPDRRTYAAMLSAMDDGIGRVMEALRTAKLDENTLVVFFSDNGGPTMEGTSVNASSNAPLRGSKRQTYEGGVRVPLIIRWKGRLPEGKVEGRPVIQLDVMPTALAAAGVELRPEEKLDGVNLLPYLTGKSSLPDRALYWRFGDHMAIRMGDWKLVKSSEGQLMAAGPEGFGDLPGAELYNLKDDIGEKNNLAAMQPQKVRQLGDAWRQWNNGLVPPLWGPAAGSPVAPKPISVNGATLSYVDAGEGTPVLFLHGSYSDLRIWQPQFRSVASQDRFIALTMRYFGKADWPDDGAGFSQATHVADVAAFIRQLNIGPVVIVGSSYGAATALGLAVQHPELVRALFLNEPALPSVVADPADLSVLGAERKALSASMQASNPAAATKSFHDSISTQAGAFESLPPPRRAIHLDNARTLPLSLDPERLLRITCAQLGQIKAATTMTRGGLTRPFFRVIAETVNRCMPGSRLIVIEGATHGAPTEKSPAFNKELLSFLGAVLK